MIKYCSPGNGDKKGISCLPYRELQYIARLLNEIIITKNKGKTKNDESFLPTIRVSEKHKDLKGQIEETLKKMNQCDKEICWLQMKELKDKLTDTKYNQLKEYFRPEKPFQWNDNPNEWLTTENINDVMEQYEKAYPNFKYYGALPIDFCKVTDLCSINLSDLFKQNINSFGVVFNVDPSNKGGQHWFSMYVDLIMKNHNKPFIYYFDSASKGNSNIQSQIFNFIEIIQNQYKELKNKELGFTFNDIQHQYQNTECGIYCLHFLTEMLRGRNFIDYIIHTYVSL